MKGNKNKEEVRKFLVFKLVAKAEHIYFEKDMLFTTPKQFKEAITKYVVHGEWGIRFVKNDLQRVRAVCQEGCKFVAYLTKVPRERSYQLRTLLWITHALKDIRVQCVLLHTLGRSR